MGFDVKSLISYVSEHLAPDGDGILGDYKALKVKASGGNGPLRMGFEVLQAHP